jgi:hypothetical protein
MVLAARFLQSSTSLMTFFTAIPSIAMVVTAIGRVIFSHLSLSDEGLDFRFWPLHRIRCKWEDVDQIKKSSLPFQGDILTLKKAEVSGYHLLLDFTKGKFGRTTTLPIIPLFRIVGWPNGILETELRIYAPALFVDPPSDNTEQATD